MAVVGEALSELLRVTSGDSTGVLLLVFIIVPERDLLSAPESEVLGVPDWECDRESSRVPEKKLPVCDPDASDVAEYE